MGKDKKKKEKQSKSVPLAEYLEKVAGGAMPIYKEIGTGESKTIINLSEANLAPHSSFEVTIDPEVKRNGPPYPITAKNVPFEATVDKIKQFFGSSEAVVEIQYDSAQRPTGVVLLTFESLDDYRRALEMSDMKMGTRSVQLTQGNKLLEYEQIQLQRRDRQRNNYDRGASDSGYTGRYTNSRYNYDEGPDPRDVSSWRRDSNAPEFPSKYTAAKGSFRTEEDPSKPARHFALDVQSWRATDKLTDANTAEPTRAPTNSRFAPPENRFEFRNKNNSMNDNSRGKRYDDRKPGREFDAADLSVLRDPSIKKALTNDA